MLYVVTNNLKTIQQTFYLIDHFMLCGYVECKFFKGGEWGEGDRMYIIAHRFYRRYLRQYFKKKQKKSKIKQNCHLL